MPFAIRISLPSPFPLNIFMTCCDCSNCLSILLTSSTLVPAPAAMRRLRLALSRAGLARSLGVMELMMASTLPMAFSAVPSGICLEI